MSMSTAVFPGASRPRPVLVPRRERGLPSLSQNKSAAAGDLTIHRITQTHHGRTLLTLGHAAEYLTNSRRYSTHSAQRIDHVANVEALHILMGLSRRVFEEYADRKVLPRRVEDWVIERAVGIVETATGRRSNV
jgi:hypothetical protein